MINTTASKNSMGLKGLVIAGAMALALVLGCIASVDAAYAEGSYSPSSAAISALSSQRVATSADDAASNHVHVVDKAGILSDAAERELSSTISNMILAYNMDIVIFTDTTVHGCSDRKVYAADFYMENHYGIGSDSNGMEMFICMESGNRGWFTVATGSCTKYVTSQSVNYVDDSITSLMKSGDFDGATKLYLNEWNGILANGGVVPGTTLSTSELVGSCLFPAVIAFFVVGFICYRSKKKKMKTIAIAQKASVYMVSESMNLTRQSDDYVTTTVVATPRPKNDDHGGQSNFGGFSSSGGTSFVGGGRNF